MTKEMLKDFIKALKRRNAFLIVLVVIISLGLVAMSVFALVSLKTTKAKTDTDCTISVHSTTGAECICVYKEGEFIKENDTEGGFPERRQRTKRKRWKD